MSGAAGETGKQAAVELLHRLLARVEGNRAEFVKAPGANEALVRLLGDHPGALRQTEQGQQHRKQPSAAGAAAAGAHRQHQIACDAAWVVGILSTWGAREELCKLGAMKHLEGIRSASDSSVPDGVRAAVEFALRTL